MNKINKNILDINFISYHSTLNFIEQICDISNELPKHPMEEQMTFLYQNLFEELKNYLAMRVCRFWKILPLII